VNRNGKRGEKVTPAAATNYQPEKGPEESTLHCWQREALQTGSGTGSGTYRGTGSGGWDPAGSEAPERSGRTLKTGSGTGSGG